MKFDVSDGYDIMISNSDSCNFIYPLVYFFTAKVLDNQDDNDVQLMVSRKYAIIKNFHLKLN